MALLNGGSESDPQPLVSIVIPTYDRARFLPACIDSALSQDYPSFEVIVVDDGSTDETPSLCESYGDRIRYFRKPNGGAASALNYGIRKMRGEWFKWLSSDDLLEPNALTSLVGGVDNPFGVVYGDFTLIDMLGRPTGTVCFTEARSQTDFIVRLWSRFTASAGGAIIRRSCFETAGLFDETLRYCEDYDWWLRATMLHGVRFHHVPAFVFRYRVHPGQVTTQLPGAGIIEDKIRANMTRLLSAQGESNRQIVECNLELTKRFRRTFGPAVIVSWLMERAPCRTSIKFIKNELLFRLVPEKFCELFWAVNPPLIPQGRDSSFIDRMRPALGNDGF